MSRTDPPLTVSGIAKLTGIDRRSLDRALANVRPVEIKQIGNRTSALFDRLEAARAITGVGLGREKAVALSPFGGSATRLLTWNAFIRLVPRWQHVVAAAAADWPSQFGCAQAHADRIGAEVGILLAQMCDEMLTDLAAHLDAIEETDRCILDFDVQGRDAAPGEFMSALGAVGEKFSALCQRALAAKQAAG